MSYQIFIKRPIAAFAELLCLGLLWLVIGGVLYVAS